MGGTFGDRIDQLREQVGSGIIKGTVDVDQIYAHYQDSGHGPRGKPAAAFDHPEGGQAGYLTNSITAYGPDFAQQIADSISEEVPMKDVFIDGVQSLSLDVATLAPMEFGNLRESSASTVIDDGDVVFDRPALVPRLSSEELDQLKKFSKWNYGGNSPGYQEYSEMGSS
jgi:hypothetical protein